MGMKVTITGAIYAKQYHTGDKLEFTFFDFDPSEAFGWIRVMGHTIDVDVPADFDIRPGQIAALQKKEQELRAQFAAAVTEIHRQISELQAIGCEVPA